jgi:zinc/manganese transport system substrate-binding protein
MVPREARPNASLPSRVLPTALALLVAGTVLLAACSSPGGEGSSSSRTGHAGGTVVHVVAAENFWGSIASQIGGTHARVVSIVTNPDTDPHSYEPTAQDARTLAGSQLVIDNGIGYDPWVPKLLAADQGHPKVLNVGDLLGVPDDGNPHRWYDPSDVHAVTAKILADLRQLDPADSAYFTEQQQHFDTVALAPYDSLISSIRARYGGTPVGASESIFSMLAPSLGLDVLTPYSFLKAISEGTEVSAGDKATIDNQIRSRAIRIYVYNRQNVTPDVQAQLNEVKAEHIPYATITETLVPPNASYQSWQTKELLGIQTALARAASTGP